MESIKERFDYWDNEDDALEEWFDAVKADVAYCLGIEEGSDEWYELMDI